MITTENMLKEVAPNHGFKRILNILSDTIIDDSIKRVKSRFGIEIELVNSVEIKAVVEWIKKYDKKFKYHIANPHAMSSSKSNDYILSGVFIIKIMKATYLFVDARRSIMINRNTDRDNNSPYIYLYLFGKRSFSVFKELSKFIDSKNTSNRLYSIVGGLNNGSQKFWECTASKLTPRTMDTIFMDPDQKQRILNHISEWIKSEEIYTERGLLFKTGILLYGTPGTGKSSLAMAIANYMGCSLITIDPTTFQYMNISEITESIVADECKYVVLIDEIDTLFKSREDQSITDEQKEKASKLLAFLDSPQSPTNVIFIATTNYIDVLDKALMRKGRFDLVEEMGDISLDIAKEMCQSFDLTDEEINKLLSFYGKDKINPSFLQDMILQEIKKKKQVDETDTEIKSSEVDVKVIYAKKYNTIEEYNEEVSNQLRTF